MNSDIKEIKDIFADMFIILVAMVAIGYIFNVSSSPAKVERITIERDTCINFSKGDYTIKKTN